MTDSPLITDNGEGADPRFTLEMPTGVQHSYPVAAPMFSEIVEWMNRAARAEERLMLWDIPSDDDLSEPRHRLT